MLSLQAGSYEVFPKSSKETSKASLVADEENKSGTWGVAPHKKQAATPVQQGGIHPLEKWEDRVGST